MNDNLREKLIKIAAVVVFFGILAILGQVFKKQIQGFRESQDAKRYPTPAQLPPAVAVSVDDALGRLQKALGQHGRGLGEQMRPGMAAGEIARVQQDSGCALPPELAAFYGWHDGSRRSKTDLQWFPSLQEAAAEVAKTRAAHEKLANGGIASRGVAVMSEHSRNWVPLYRDAAGCALNVDVTRRPDEGAYFWTRTAAGEFCFFPSLQNALTALAECFEQGVFREIDSTEKPDIISQRDDEIAGEQSKQLQVNGPRLKEVMAKYGTWMEAQGLGPR